jgi:hypothetical protein
MVYHGIDSDRYRPISAEHPITLSSGAVISSKAEAKAVFGIPEDAVLALRVDRNSGRKNFGDTWRALVPVMQRNKNLYAWFHCKAEGDGLNLPQLFSRDESTAGRFYYPGEYSTRVGWKENDLIAHYNAADYFSLDEMRRKFSIEIRTCNMPEAGDWRIDINNQALVEQKEQYERHYQELIGNMVGDFKERLIAALSNISSKLVPAPEGEKSNGKRMHASILSNVLDILPMAYAFGLGEDSQIASMRRKIEDMLDGVSVDALKHDPLVRDDVKRGVDQIIRDLPSIDFN